jgi:ATP-dependent helicase/nuclease subunit A
MFEAEAHYARREAMNLLYVAITRAKQVLLVSGHGKNAEAEEKKALLSWYDRIAHAVAPAENPMLAHAVERQPIQQPLRSMVDAALQYPLVTGKRAASETREQRRGTWLHALLQHLSEHGREPDQLAIQARYGIPQEEIQPLWQQALAILQQAGLRRFFDASVYLDACNEMPYVNAQGELKRIDRLVEFADEVWVLDYKTGVAQESAKYAAQMAEYRSAMQSVYAGKTVRCGLIFAEENFREIEF